MCAFGCQTQRKDLIVVESKWRSVMAQYVWRRIDGGLLLECGGTAVGKSGLPRSRSSLGKQR
jgi:hypothetical protein